jgi:hypothetical protein
VEAGGLAGDCGEVEVKIIEEHLRKLHNLPAEFRFYRFSVHPDFGPVIYELEGGVVPLITRGVNKGKPNWKKRTDVQRFIVKVEEIKKIHAAWEQETRTCSRCMGLGAIFWSWSKANGSERKPCPLCGGTGKPVVRPI